MIPILKGIRVLDLTSVILGPYATQTLGDLGADVIKIESPDGDNMRPIAPVAEPGVSALFSNNNRNKRSIVLDLKTEPARVALRKLVGTADVLVHNMRQDAIDKLGFGFAAVRALNARLIYCAAVGFGRDGPYAGKPAYDDVIQAESGFAGLFAQRDGAPMYAPSIIADKVVGLHLVSAVLAALFHRERTGVPPDYVEVPMFETMVAFNLNEHLSGATFGDNTNTGYQRTMTPNRRPYKTADGWIGVLPYTPVHWAKVLAEIGLGHVPEEPWFKDPTERSRNFDRLYGYLAEALPRRTSADWIATFERLDVPSGPVRSVTDLLADPHLNAVGMFETNFSGSTHVQKTLRTATSFGGVEREKDLPPPRLGADTEAVLREAGCSESELAQVLNARSRKV
jgi:crotonobetainyl-CoA:carnitine CoA-transferase CaiB-like acyl-CoA transferase